jgi:hypothetical protein
MLARGKVWSGQAHFGEAGEAPMVPGVVARIRVGADPRSGRTGRTSAEGTARWRRSATGKHVEIPLEAGPKGMRMNKDSRSHETKNDDV